MVNFGDEVEKVLANSEQARNSDKFLLLKTLMNRGIGFTPDQADIFLSVNFESVTRARRKFQEQGQYVPTDPVVREKRGFKALMVQQQIPGLDGVKTANLISSNYG